MTLMHEIVGKAALAAHIRTPHLVPGTRTKVRAVAIDLPELRRWRRDELEDAHRELHEPEVPA